MILPDGIALSVAYALAAAITGVQKVPSGPGSGSRNRGDEM